MYVWFRSLKVGAAALAGRRLGLTDASRLRMRVWPGDVDYNRHLNNGRYLALMDLGRIDLLFRAGLFREGVKRRWMPVLAAADIRFRRSLALFQTFELITSLVTWDQKWFFMEQRFEARGDLYAQAFVKAAVKSPGGIVPPGEIISVMGGDPVPPPPEGAPRGGFASPGRDEG